MEMDGRGKLEVSFWKRSFYDIKRNLDMDFLRRDLL